MFVYFNLLVDFGLFVVLRCFVGVTWVYLLWFWVCFCLVIACCLLVCGWLWIVFVDGLLFFRFGCLFYFGFCDCLLVLNVWCFDWVVCFV